MARLIVPEANEVPSILASTAVLARVVVSTLSSMQYQVSVLSAPESEPICALSSSFHSSKVLSAFILMLTLFALAALRIKTTCLRVDASAIILK